MLFKINSKTMKLLFLNTNIGYGGAEKMIVWLANQCAENGHDVTFFTYRDNKIMQPLSRLVKYNHVQLETGGASLSMLRTVQYLHDYIKEEKFEIGVAFLSPSMLRMALAAKGTKMKVIFSHRGDPYYRAPQTSLKLKLFGRLNSWAFRQADWYVFQTQQAKEYFCSEIQSRSTVIPNPITPLARTKGREGKIEKVIVTVGRIDIKQKRQDLLIEAFNLISPKYPDFELRIYGSGENEAELTNLAKTNGRIKLMGKTSKVAEAIQNAAFFVLTSDFEGIPNALLEAMSLGLPCISTDCSPGGAKMVIDGSDKGIVVERGNAKKLSEAMEYLILNPDSAEKMGNSAMEVNTRFHQCTISKMWLDIISKVKQ